MTEKQTPHFTSEQRASMKSRSIEEARLLSDGADYDEHGRLDPTEEQKDALYKEHILEPERKKFLETTEEGLQIKGHVSLLNKIANDISIEILRNAMVNRRKASVIDIRSLEQRYDTYLEDNGLDFDFEKMRAVETGSTEAKAYTYEVLDTMLACREELEHNLATRLSQRSDLRLGTGVTVLRSPRDGETRPRKENGWTIQSITAQGKLRVRHEEKPDEYVIKDLPIRAIEAINPVQ